MSSRPAATSISAQELIFEFGAFLLVGDPRLHFRDLVCEGAPNARGGGSFQADEEGEE